MATKKKFNPDDLDPDAGREVYIFLNPDAPGHPDSQPDPNAYQLETGSELTTLRAKIRAANLAYHSGKGRLRHTDDEYDAMLARLKRLSPKDPLLSEIGAPPARGKKVRLPIPMPSLPKVRVGEKDFFAWMKGNPGPYVVSDKLDGVSGELVATDKGLRLYTRGDGTTGTDISHLVSVLRGIGRLRKGQILRGEIIVTTQSFKSGLSKSFANQRNLAAAIVNKTKVIHPDAHKAVFVVHEVLRPKKSLDRAATSLKAAGFIVVPFKVLKSPSTEALEKFLKSRRGSARSDIDGLVIESSNGDRVALKGINEVATATVKSVEWAVSRHGRLKPVVWFIKPVVLAGAKIGKATGINAKFIKDNGIGPGAIVTVVRSGEVIPKITSVVKSTMASLPEEGTYVWDKNGTEIMSSSDEPVAEQKVQVLVNALKYWGIKTFKAGTMAALVRAGIDTVEELIKASKSHFTGAGLGRKRSEDLFSEIRVALKSIDYTVMMAASGKWPPGFGLRRMRLIDDALDGGKGLFVNPLPNSKMMAKLLAAPGIGHTVASDFMRGLVEFRKFLRDTGWRPSVSRKTATKTSLTGKKFVFTGFRDKELSDKLESMGASVASSVGPTADYVVTPNPKGNTIKLQKARQHGVDIISPDSAWELINQA